MNLHDGKRNEDMGRCPVLFCFKKKNTEYKQKNAKKMWKNYCFSLVKNGEKRDTGIQTKQERSMKKRASSDRR